MSTVEETQEQAMGPCPNCKGGNVTVPGVKSVLHQVKCSGCGMRGPIAVTEADAIDNWNRLSDAAALARAVERVQAWLRDDGGAGMNVFAESTGHITIERLEGADYVGPTYCEATFAAALIALAEQIEDTP